MVIYVDDLILIGIQFSLMHEVKNDLKIQFEMTYLGLLHYFLGLHIWRMDNDIFLSYPKYVTNLLA